MPLLESASGVRGLFRGEELSFRKLQKQDISPEEFWELEEDNEYKNITWTPVGEFK